MRYEQTAVGDKYVAENMMANNQSIGGVTVRTYYFQPLCSWHDIFLLYDLIRR